jgi:hypothetical protein
MSPSAALLAITIACTPAAAPASRGATDPPAAVRVRASETTRLELEVLLKPSLLDGPHATPTESRTIAFVRPAEGAPWTVERGLADGEVLGEAMLQRIDALKVAETVASSLLVRTAITGGDPNWGRIIAAAGRAGVAFRANDLELHVGGILIFRDGQPVEADKGAVRAAFNGGHVDIVISLGATEGSEAEVNSDSFLSCGLTTEYVRLNADYTT